jgi:hypothetical protein
LSWFQRSKSGAHASSGSRLPLARSEELAVEEVGDELLIYDKTTNRAHCLSAAAVKVWRACDGYTSTDVLCTEVDLGSETVDQVLDELDSNSLLQDTPQIGHTRREMTIKAAKLGTAASVPFIYSVLGPVPMAAATPTPAQCLHYSAGNCGTNTSGCGSICGCCCCCTGCATTSGATGCSICYPFSMCPQPPPGNQPCPSNAAGLTTSGCTTSTCSTAGPGCVQPCTNTPPSDACTSAFPNPCPAGF